MAQSKTSTSLQGLEVSNNLCGQSFSGYVDIDFEGMIWLGLCMVRFWQFIPVQIDLDNVDLLEFEHRDTLA